jgi:hypothetical protein
VRGLDSSSVIHIACDGRILVSSSYGSDFGAVNERSSPELDLSRNLEPPSSLENPKFIVNSSGLIVKKMFVE